MELIGGRAKVGESHVNDAAVGIADWYAADEGTEHPALRHWSDVRRAEGRPFRPAFQMYTGHGSPAMTAERLELLQRLGAEAIQLAWDLPSQLGFDPDHRLSRSQVGRAGVSCSSLDDMKQIASRIDPSSLRSFGTLANSLGHVGFAMVHETMRDAGATSTPIYLQNDPLKEFTARGTEIFDPTNALRLACDVAQYYVDHQVPGHAITVCSNHFDIAGSGPVVALGLALANGVAYMDELVSRSISAESAASTISLFVNERSDFMITAALFRSTRVLWADLLQERYGLDPATTEPLFLMGYAHGLEAPEEPLVNVARVAVSVTAATFGGADILSAAAYDEALRIPSDDAAALSLRTIQVASSEHGVADTLDPLRGGYKFESLCDQIIAESRQEYDAVQHRGGAIECISNGYVLSRLSDRQHYRHDQLVSGARPWFGVNQAVQPELRHLFSGASQGDRRLRESEIELADAVRNRKSRFARVTEAPLSDVREAAAGVENIIAPTIAALRSGATLEQIVTATRQGFEATAQGGRQ